MHLRTTQTAVQRGTNNASHFSDNVTQQLTPCLISQQIVRDVRNSKFILVQFGFLRKTRFRMSFVQFGLKKLGSVQIL